MDYTVCRVVALMVILTGMVAAFNLSPQPNIVLRDPHPNTTSRGSYFGYTINLRRHSLLVGAPRAQSVERKQLNIKEPGAIYKCSLNQQYTDGKCSQFTFEKSGNNPSAFHGEIRDGQWLGASMDGGRLESNQFVVCAPRMYSNSSSNEYHLNQGICYLTSETNGVQPNASVSKIRAIQTKMKFILQGISVHVTDNDQEILMGAPGFSGKGSVFRYVNNVIEVPAAPNQNEYNSYFGFAVSSGYFSSKDKLLYVASAPQAKYQLGAVYIFNITGSYSKDILIRDTFVADQMGEYFGYALAVDDFNGDQWPDVAVAAPFHAGDSFENGVVYVFLNDRGNGFKRPAMVLRPTHGGPKYVRGGRFGSALSRLGDINHDGYNDLAVGAPFEGNGAVYIFLGGPSGLETVPSQKLVSPPSTTANSMFGHGLSKGSDIDGNQYRDLAVGAPNAESVFVYRAYPVGKVMASITPDRKSLDINDKKLRLIARWRLNTSHPFEHKANITITILMDAEHGRIMNEKNQTTVSFNDKIGTSETIYTLDVSVANKENLIYRPVTFVIHFDVLESIPDSAEFCSTCIAINPVDPKLSQSMISFSTGCTHAICVADLSITSTMLPPSPYVVGTSKSIEITYTIHNAGERAFYTQLRVRITEASVMFMATPSECDRSAESASEMLCTINHGHSLKTGSDTPLRILLDTSVLSGKEFRVRVEASSNGEEFRLYREDVVPLTELSELEVAGQSTVPQIGLNEDVDIVQFAHVFEVHNTGPSMVDAMNVTVVVPVTYITTDVLDSKKITIQASYDNRVYEIEWMQDDDSSKPAVGPREWIDPFISSLDENRTIFFDCDNPDVSCIRARFTVFNFVAGHVPLVISLNMSLNLDLIDAILKGDRDIFLLRSAAEFINESKLDSSTVSVKSTRPYIAVFKYSTINVPIWVYVLSVLGGLLILYVVTYGMSKLGFFRRQKKVELKELKRKSIAMALLQDTGE